jgi:NAD(P)-dependent dehydrogenase (short-subunit alcohol dehydrogenase family)
MSTESASVPVALVTGADKGIGLETARRLAGAGYRVYLTARSSQRGGAAAVTAGARFLELDVTSDESVRHAAGCIEQTEGRLDMLVNNAGITGPVRDDPHDYTTGGMTEVLLTNVVGYLRVIHAFLPLLEKGDDSRIVNVSSGLGSFTCFPRPQSHWSLRGYAAVRRVEGRDQHDDRACREPAAQYPCQRRRPRPDRNRPQRRTGPFSP